jgi:predicted AlkP superfamily phosphohydrolase/phosphomutase
MATQLLIIGLDGATWRLLAPWARGGRLPHLAALMARGTWGPLRSTVPALTLPAWASFMTGKNPGGHGVYAFQRLAPDRYTSAGLANARDLGATPFWDIAGRAGRSVGVINVPPSYPLRPLPRGYVVGCMLTPPGERLTEPPDVRDDLGEYEIDAQAPKGLRRADPTYREQSLSYLRAIRRQTTLRAEATLRLMARRPTDALCVVFYAPDRVQHYFWEYLDPDAPRAPADADVQRALEEVFIEVDAAIGRLVSAAGPDATVVLVSDHGFGAKPALSVRVNRWLANEGLLRRHPFWRLRRRIIKKMLPTAWRARWDTLDHILVDRPRTRAWSEALFTGTAGIWVHLAGRYPHGSVAPGVAYEAVRDRIIRGLDALVDPEGHRVFETVRRREELYHGPFVERAPDVVAVCTPRFGIIFESLGRELRDQALFGPFEELGYTGTHDPLGIYLFAGPPIVAAGERGELPIEAVTPAILHLLDVPVPRDLDQPVRTDLLRPEYLRAHPVRLGDAIAAPASGDAGWRSEEDEARVADHLRALGYLE